MLVERLSLSQSSLRFSFGISQAPAGCTFDSATQSLALSRKHVDGMTLERSTSDNPWQKRQTVKVYRVPEDNKY